MGRQIKGLLYFFMTDIRYSLFIFWTILMSILVVSLSISYVLKDMENGFMTLSLTGPIYVYCAILGFLTVKEAIPFSIKMGAIRKNLFVSLGIFFVGLSTVLAIVANIIQVIVELLNKKIGIDLYYFIHITYFMDDTWLTRVIIDISIMFFFLSLLFTIGLLFYKYGLAGGGSVIGLLASIIIVGVAQGWLIDFFIQIFQGLDLLLFIQLFVIGFILYCLTFVLLRRITILNVK